MKYRNTLFLLGLSLLLFMQCAKRGNPTGGPKDEMPPILLRAIPKQNTTQLDAERVRLYFDEYVKLNKLKNQLIISPPLDPSSYIISPQGSAAKYVEINMSPDSLQKNTTYSFNFGQSIVDNNEGNPFSYFRYVFSTGDYVDSLQVRGTIGNAFGRETKNFVSVMLYAIDSTYTDSVIYQRPPDYITNTLDSLDVFEISNVREGRYLLVAQKDIANNYTFDQSADEIGFAQSFIDVPTDRLFHLDLFLEETDFALGRAFQAAENRIGLSYYGNPNDLKVRTVELADSVQTMQSYDLAADSLYIWYKNLKADSLQLDIERDTLKTTLTHTFRSAAADSLVLKPSITSIMNLGELLQIEASTPITRIDTSQIVFIDKDSLAVPFAVTMEHPQQMRFEFDVLPNDMYKLQLLPGALTDFFEGTNDTLLLSFRTKKPADYGSVYLQLVDIPSFPIIIELTDENENVVQSMVVTEPQRRYVFSNIIPKKYYVRVIIDENKNGKWDAGRFLDRRLPEPVFHYDELLDVRANWELQEQFQLK